MLGEEYFTRLSQANKDPDPISWFYIFQKLSEYVDNEFYNGMGKHRLTGKYISVIDTKHLGGYDSNKHAELEEQIKGFVEQNLQYPDLVELTQQAWNVAQGIAERVRVLSNEEEPEQFYRLGWNLVKDYVDDMQRAITEMSKKSISERANPK